MSPLPFQVFCLLGTYLSIYQDYCDEYMAINLSDYSYPKSNDADYYRIAIFGTNDLHGSVFPLQIPHPLENTTYKYGGLEYLANYVKILREEWRERLLWLDGGDQFQGAIESKISNGTIMTDFLNTMHIDGSVIGNHEFDFGQPYLYERLESAGWDYLAANVVNNKTNQTEFLPHTKVAKMFHVGKVKIGVIGLSTVETPFTTSGDLTNIKFLEYREILIRLSRMLKSNGAHAIILASHIGMKCNNDFDKKMILQMRNYTTAQGECEKSDEMNILLNSLDEGVIDAVVAGHMHDVTHHWVKGVPVVQTTNGGYFSNVFYLTFDKDTLQLKKEGIEIEGPLPTCEKVFTNTKQCQYITKAQAQSAGELSTFTFHNKLIQSDQSLDVVFEKWWRAVEPYKIIIGYTDETLVRNSNNENPLGNFGCDALKNKTGADITILNDGSFRSTWFPGNILIEHMYNMLPFENTIVSWEMTGAEVKKMMNVVQRGTKAFYHTSGLMMNVTLTPKSVSGIKLFDGREIDDLKTYKIGSNDFLLGGGDDFRNVASWYTPRNVQMYGSLRILMIDYLKFVKEISTTKFIDPTRRRLNVINPARKNLKNIEENNK